MSKEIKGVLEMYKKVIHFFQFHLTVQVDRNTNFTYSITFLCLRNINVSIRFGTVLLQ